MHDSKSSKKQSFCAEDIDGVLLGGFPGGVGAEMNPDGSGDRKRQQDEPERERNRHAGVFCHDFSNTDPHADPDRTAEEGEKDRFQQELDDDIVFLCTEGADSTTKMTVRAEFNLKGEIETMNENEKLGTSSRPYRERERKTGGKDCVKCMCRTYFSPVFLA